MQVARGRTEYCAAHGGGMKCRAENCLKAAGGKYLYCKEHLPMYSGADVDYDEVEEDELFSGGAPESYPARYESVGDKRPYVVEAGGQSGLGVATFQEEHSDNKRLKSADV